MRFLRISKLTLVAIAVLAIHSVLSLDGQRSNTVIVTSSANVAIPLRRRFDMGISSPYYPSVAVIPIWHIILGVYAPVLTYHLSISVSAAAFLDFYLSILDLLLTVWSELQPMHQVVIRYGNLGLEIGCSTEPIPWGGLGESCKLDRAFLIWPLIGLERSLSSTSSSLG